MDKAEQLTHKSLQSGEVIVWQARSRQAEWSWLQLGWPLVMLVLAAGLVLGLRLSPYILLGVGFGVMLYYIFTLPAAFSNRPLYTLTDRRLLVVEPDGTRSSTALSQIEKLAHHVEPDGSGDLMLICQLSMLEQMQEEQTLKMARGFADMAYDSDEEWQREGRWKPFGHDVVEEMNHDSRYFGLDPRTQKRVLLVDIPNVAAALTHFQHIVSPYYGPSPEPEHRPSQQLPRRWPYPADEPATRNMTGGEQATERIEEEREWRS